MYRGVYMFRYIQIDIYKFLCKYAHVYVSI